MIKTAAAAVLVLSLSACSQEAAGPTAGVPALVPQAQAAAPQSASQPALQPADEQPDANQLLAARVRAALDAESGVPAGAIDVTASDGAITLWGAVSSSGERKRAEAVAARVDGVTSVANQLSVVKGS